MWIFQNCFWKCCKTQMDVFECVILYWLNKMGNVHHLQRDFLRMKPSGCFFLPYQLKINSSSTDSSNKFNPPSAVESFGKPRSLKFTWKWHKNPPQRQVGTILLTHPRSLVSKFPRDNICLTYMEHGLDDFRVTLQRKFIAAMSFTSTVNGFYVVADWYKTHCATMSHLSH